MSSSVIEFPLLINLEDYILKSLSLNLKKSVSLIKSSQILELVDAGNEFKPNGEKRDDSDLRKLKPSLIHFRIQF